MIDDALSELNDAIGKSLEALRRDLAKLRTGRAHPSILDGVMVSYYGVDTPLKQVANVSVEDARTLAISAWEKSLIPQIEKAIMKSDLGITPNTAGTVIRVPLPALTEERRRDLTKVVKHEAENARVAIRNVRRDVMQELKEMLKEKLVSKDEDHRAQDEVQKLTDKFVAEVDHVLVDKEKELMQV